MKKAITLLTLVFAGFLISGVTAQESNQKLYRIYVKDFNLIKNIESQGISVYNMKPGAYIEVMALPAQMENLDIEGTEVELLGNSFEELYPDQTALKSGGAFHNYQATMAELISIASAHPDITKLDTIGFSLGGRAICSLKISDNPNLDEDEPPILFAGNHHGNEIHSIEATLFQINFLMDNYGTDPEVTTWVNSMEIWYVPLVNPDGREAMRRTNDHDVDLNRNYSFGFTPGGSHGPEPFSEPETRAIRDLAAKYPPVMSLSYHTSGQYVLYPWTHTDDAAPDSAAMVYLGNLISESITFPGGHYTLLQGGRWYFTAGEYCDYMYVTHNTLAYTVEMGTSQSPDYSVVPAMVERNLNGMKTMLRQVGRAGVSGMITDAYSGRPLMATVDIPSIDNQEKVPPRLSDSLFGRYYRYLAPGTYSFQISAYGYRTQVAEVTISPDSLTHWDIKMERSAAFQVEEVKLWDGNFEGTAGNADGFANLGETLGFSFSLANGVSIDASRAYARVSSANPNIHFLTDSLYFGTIEGNSSKGPLNTALFRIDPACPDGEEIEVSIAIGDSVGFGWMEYANIAVNAPKLDISLVGIDDSGGNDNGIFDNGETVSIMLRFRNHGHQDIHELAARLISDDPYFKIVSDSDETPQLDIDETGSFSFTATLAIDAPRAYLSVLRAEFSSVEGFTASFTFGVNNIDGFYDDFEGRAKGWVHDSYGTTENDHDDWQLGTPAGKGDDPGQAFSGDNCWGTDMGWDSWEGTSWDGNYQANVYNYLSSPEIDCSDLNGVGLKFMRWLTIRISDFARVKVNNVVVWENTFGIMDASWTEQILDISGIADHNPSVIITFELQSNSNGTSGGWNIDDVIVAGGLFPGSTSAKAVLIPEETVLYDARPNPFQSQTSIRYYTSVDGRVDLNIYDQTGKKVRTLVSARQSSGEHEIVWDGRMDDGNMVPVGIYLYQLRTAKSISAGRLVRQ